MPGAIWLIGAAYLVAILLPARRADWAEPAAVLPGVVPPPRSAEPAEADAAADALAVAGVRELPSEESPRSCPIRSRG
jgi:hypothetical protein